MIDFGCFWHQIDLAALLTSMARIETFIAALSWGAVRPRRFASRVEMDELFPQRNQLA